MAEPIVQPNEDDYHGQEILTLDEHGQLVRVAKRVSLRPAKDQPRDLFLLEVGRSARVLRDMPDTTGELEVIVEHRGESLAGAVLTIALVPQVVCWSPPARKAVQAEDPDSISAQPTAPPPPAADVDVPPCGLSTLPKPRKARGSRGSGDRPRA